MSHPAEQFARELAQLIVAYVDAAATPGKLRETIQAYDALVKVAQLTGWVHPKERKKPLT